jgi:hypothetical protein
MDKFAIVWCCYVVSMQVTSIISGTVWTLCWWHISPVASFCEVVIVPGIMQHFTHHLHYYSTSVSSQLPFMQHFCPSEWRHQSRSRFCCLFSSVYFAVTPFCPYTSSCSCKLLSLVVQTVGCLHSGWQGLLLSSSLIYFGRPSNLIRGRSSYNFTISWIT